MNTPRYDTSAWVMHVHNHIALMLLLQIGVPFRVLLPVSTGFNGTSVCTRGVIVPPTGKMKTLHCQDVGVSKQQQDLTSSYFGSYNVTNISIIYLNNVCFAVM